MTIAVPDLGTLIAEAASAIVEQATAAMRPAEFRRVWRKTHTALRANGYEYSYQRGAATALRTAFPEYAAMIPDTLSPYGEETLPRDLEQVLGRPPRIDVGTPPVIPDPLPPAVEDDDEDQEDECNHEDYPQRCVHCSGLHENDCYGEYGHYHQFSCDECGSELDECRDCEASQNCSHQWQCQGCDAIDTDGVW